MKKYRVFDLDGTLADSMPVWSEGMLRFLIENKISYPEDIVKRIAPLGTYGAAQYFLTLGASEALAEQVRKQFHTSVYERYAHEISLKSGVKEFLRKRKAEGDGLYVLTASPHLTTDACLKNNGVYELFDDVFSTDDFSLPKSDIKIYEMLCEKIGCKPQDIRFYDDNLTNLKTAKEAGVYAVGIYDLTSDDLSEEMESVADEYHRSFEEML